MPLPSALLQRLANLRRVDISIEDLMKVRQHQLSLEIDLVTFDAVYALQQGEVQEEARLTYLIQQYAGAWFNVVPSPSFNLHLRAPLSLYQH